MRGNPVDEREVLRQAHKVRRLLSATAIPDLDLVDPRDTPGVPGRAPKGADAKAWSRAELARLEPYLRADQECLFARARAGVDRQRLLVVLQAVDCGGKDGAVRSLAGTMNPSGLRLTVFGIPTPEERAQHFLWRINRALPPAGYVGVFNRSHYEDVLVARVRGLVEEEMWRRRFDEINRFEQDLIADGLTIVKVLLYISAAEQRARLLARLDDPTKRWKFDPADLDDRDRWSQYQRAYADVLRQCTTEAAPWYVVPADRKWYRNWAVANLVLAHLDDLHLEFPDVTYDIERERARLLAEPEGERQVNN